MVNLLALEQFKQNCELIFLQDEIKEDLAPLFLRNNTEKLCLIRD